MATTEAEPTVDVRSGDPNEAGYRPFGRGWWQQDWPEAEHYFLENLVRLTRINSGEAVQMPLTDQRVWHAMRSAEVQA